MRKDSSPVMGCKCGGVTERSGSPWTTAMAPKPLNQPEYQIFSVSLCCWMFGPLSALHSPYAPLLPSVLAFSGFAQSASWICDPSACLRDLWSEHSVPLCRRRLHWLSRWRTSAGWATFGNTEPYKTITQWWRSRADPLSLFSPLNPPCWLGQPCRGALWCRGTKGQL